ncbi:hypothetical protein K492DRAFT_130956 [Lichtheimia hyalospora FSU 10163]|nr:hypothetical protein K492DRAFT_130956 [Lichtheimia hyalospora FSU 10163]
MEDATLYNGKQRQQPPHPPPTPPPSADHVKKQKNHHNPVDEELDFVRVKPSQQVSIFTFWQAMEPYFRQLTEDDRRFLMKKDEEVESTFQVPPLGKHYLEQWNEEDRIATEISSRHSSRTSDILDDGSQQGLLERLLSSLIPEHEEEQQQQQQQHSNEDPDAIISHYEQPETPSFEDRLRQEMQYIGILSDDVDEHNWNAREDDDISAEIRRLGRELKEQINTNDYRKNRLLQVVDTQLQYDQYRQVLDVLESQVEQSYMKRFRVQKAKKRKSGSSTKAGLSENTVAAMEKRNMFIKELGPLFVDKNLVLPSNSIYDDE